MTTVLHPGIPTLTQAAAKHQKEILQTPVAFYFRIFNSTGTCTTIHLFYKP